MPIDLNQVASINPEKFGNGQVWISWIPKTAGLTWQVYISGGATGSGWIMHPAGLATGLWIVVPPTGVSRVVIGAVDPADANTDFSADLPAAPCRRAELSWTGGTAEGADLDHFAVYMGPTPGAAVDFTKPVATVKAFPGGSPVASGNFSWTSGDLTSGTWNFAVAAVDSVGNESSFQTTSQTILVPPTAPPPFPDGLSLHYVVNNAGEAPGSDPTVTLTWNASSD